MVRTILNSLAGRRAARTRPEVAVLAAPCAECPLAACRRGARSVVTALRCDLPDACRLRALGLMEGAPVTVLDCRHGLLLEVRGARVALSAAIAAQVSVRPLAA